MRGNAVRSAHRSIRLGLCPQVYAPCFNKNFNKFNTKVVILTVAGARERLAGASEKIAGRRFVNEVACEKTAGASEKSAVKKCVKAGACEKVAGRRFVNEARSERTAVRSV